MPIQRRLPKMGFKSRVSSTVDEVNLTELASLKVDVIDLEVLKKAGLVNKNIRDVKVILSGEVTTALKLRGLRLTKGARKAIEDVGGSVEA